MASDYTTIRKANERRYGTDIGRIGPMLLTNRYDDRTHFIYELLQNAEDALARRNNWKGSHAVDFRLTKDMLRISHYGKPFDERDVRGICGIAESTKDLTTIGRFGIGFKSVNAFTDRPEVHSGKENFAIENLVWPFAATIVDLKVDETVILLPLKAGDESALDEITRGLLRLGPRTLLFLRHIDEIAWTVDDGPTGLYLRSKPEIVGDKVRRISVVGETNGKADVEETWLVFSRDVMTPEGNTAGYVEIAYSISQGEDPDRSTVEPVNDSPLVVFFPTVVPTHLGFLVQGPYNTTPSRDNVRRDDPWNQYLVNETASLLVETLHWMRDSDMLNTAALRCLPLDRDNFDENSMFAPLFDATRQALTTEQLLPRFDDGYVAATKARLARTQELRKLITPSQLAALFGSEDEIFWLSGDITQNRALELRQYIMNELDVMEVTPEALMPKLTEIFLEDQPDDWIRELYEFLHDQPALRRHGRLDSLPLIRLESGKHVITRSDDEPIAFLPSVFNTGFPTVRSTVCNSDDALKFLQSLGLTEPDPVDDIIRYVLPKYRSDEINIDNNEYEDDIHRVLEAFTTDSKAQRDKLIGALRQTAFVMAVDAGDGSKCLSKPDEVYQATERLKALFAGVASVLLVDNSYACLRGEDVRDLLEACGTTRVLQRISTETDLTWDELSEIRRNAGLERSTWDSPIEDFTLRGMHELLELLPQLDVRARQERSGLLWEALIDLENRRGSKAFITEYRWSYSHESMSEPINTAFVRQLNKTAWVLDSNNELQRPEFIVIETLGWKTNPFLQSKILFKPPIIEALAKEAGFEPGVLDLLKKHGVTNLDELTARLGITEESQQSEGETSPELIEDEGDATELTNDGSDSTDSELVDVDDEGNESEECGTGQSNGDGTTQEPGSDGARPFISYVGAQPKEIETDPDGLDHEDRMNLEEKAIKFILAREPDLLRTPTGNHGYDLYEAGEDNEPIRWVEVKSMTGCLNDRPVGLSRTQFEYARKHGLAYWLYVVEHANSDKKARIVRIQDPAGRAKTFTFDHGWIEIAEVDGPAE